MNEKLPKPKKFIQSYTCECFQPHNYCNCIHKIVSTESFVRSAVDASIGISQVMKICGVSETKAKQSKDIVLYYLLNFQEVRHRIDSVPRKRLFRLDLINDLARKCNMTYIETQLSYSIIKRAFRAFYYGTDEGGVPNALLLKQLKHSHACVWFHAARRTAQIAASYVGMFTVVQKNIELQIRQIYRKVYENIKRLVEELEEDHDCTCLNCFKRIMAENLARTQSSTDINAPKDKYEMTFRSENEEARLSYWGDHMDGPYINDENPTPGTCPSLRKHVEEYAIPEIAESTNTGCSQGPFQCLWYISNGSSEEDVVDEGEGEEEIGGPIGPGPETLSEDIICPPCNGQNDEMDEEGEEEEFSCCSCTCESCSCSSERTCSGTASTEIPEEMVAEAEEEEVPVEPENIENEPIVRRNLCHVPINPVDTTVKKRSKGRRKEGTLSVNRSTAFTQTSSIHMELSGEQEMDLNDDFGNDSTVERTILHGKIMKTRATNTVRPSQINT